MKKQLLLLTFLFLATALFSQQRIDGNFSFQTNPAKKYSIYIPSGYDAATPHTLMLGLHPLNTNRWDGESWCDTLIAFAEMNNLLMICPDGGVDGAIDDPIDTAFTTAVLDSMFLWYNVNPEKVYAMGFSWGGKTVYTYGLNHVDRFAGFMPIGAAVNVSEVNGIETNANGHPFFLVHGANDSPNTRFTPLKNAMEENHGCVNSLLMPGVGHTIDFPSRNEILSEAFQWLDSVSCAETTATVDLGTNKTFSIYPNPAASGELIQIEIPANWNGNVLLELTDTRGNIFQNKTFPKNSISENQLSFLIKNPPAGFYFLPLKNEKGDLITVKLQVF